MATKQEEPAKVKRVRGIQHEPTASADAVQSMAAMEVFDIHDLLIDIHNLLLRIAKAVEK